MNKEVPRMRWFALLVSALGICLAGRVLAEGPLFEQDPYDQVTLNENNGGAVLKVQPLALPDRRLPAMPDPDGNLVIRLVDQPDKKYEVAWKAICKVELFEQMLLNKANELLAANNLDEAYDYFRFLEENYSRMPGLAEAHNELLFKQAKVFFGKRQYRNALAVLRELHRRSPQRAKLDSAMGAMTDKLLEEYAAAADYASVRALLGKLAECYPNHALLRKWETRLREKAAADLAEAQRARQAGDLHKAAASIRQVMLLWPALDGAKELAGAIDKQYPRVVVGVRQAAADRSAGGPGDGMEHLTRLGCAPRCQARIPKAQRTRRRRPPRRAVHLSLSAPTKVDDGRRRITISFDSAAAVSAYDVARGLLAMADRTSPASNPEWSAIFAAVAAPDAKGLDIELAEARMQPQALLDGMPLGEALSAAVPYARIEATLAEATYVLNPRYFARSAGQPREIVQRTFADAAAGVTALRRGEIQVLDRLDPWQVNPCGPMRA